MKADFTAANDGRRNGWFKSDADAAAFRWSQSVNIVIDAVRSFLHSPISVPILLYLSIRFVSQLAALRPQSSEEK